VIVEDIDEPRVSYPFREVPHSADAARGPLHTIEDIPLQCCIGNVSGPFREARPLQNFGSPSSRSKSSISRVRF
jgi:hypothetical protein